MVLSARRGAARKQHHPLKTSSEVPGRRHILRRGCCTICLPGVYNPLVPTNSRHMALLLPNACEVFFHPSVNMVHLGLHRVPDVVAPRHKTPAATCTEMLRNPYVLRGPQKGGQTRPMSGQWKQTSGGGP